MNLSANGTYDPEGRRKYLSRTEGRNFLHHAGVMPQADALFCQTLFYTGCRISEALSLRVSDIDTEMKAVLIRSLKKRGKKEFRRVPIPEFLAKALREFVPPGEGDRIWPISRTKGWRIIKRAMKDAGISGVHATTKGLRHGFGVRSAMVQIPLPLIQRWMGHADLSTTAIYLAVKDEEERELIGKTWDF